MVGMASALGRLGRIIGLGICLVLLALPADYAGAELMPISRFGPDGSESTNFDRIGSVAVDQQNGAVYVLDGVSEELLKFGPAGEQVMFGGANPAISGNRIEGITPYTDLSRARATSQIAVNSVSHTIYVTEEHVVRAFTSEGEPSEFTAGPGLGTNELPGFTELFGLAVDANGAIYAVDGAGSMSVFAPSGEPLVTVPLAQESFNLAVGGDGSVYLLQALTEQGEQSVTKLSPSSFPVTESTTYSASTFASRENPNFIDGIGIDPVSNHVYLLETNIAISYIREYDESGVLVESIGEPGTAGEDLALGGAAQGLAILGTSAEIGPGETVKFYAGDTDESTSQVVLFGSKIVTGPPSISALRVTDVTSDSAVLRAEINPNTAATTYRFEYGLEDCSVSVCTSIPVGGANIGDGTEEVAVAQALSGLSPATTYHYRVVAENELGAPTEAAGTFATQANGLGFELADDRVWELVSPPDKRGAKVLNNSIGLIQAAADGNGISYLTRGSIEADPEGNRNIESSQVMGRRSAGGAWSAKDITPSNVRTIPLGVGNQSEYKLFTPELSTAMLEPRDGAALSPLATERTPYLREESEPPLFTPLVTGAEGVANVPEGREFGGSPRNAYGDVKIAGADEDLGHIVLTSAVSLIEDPDAPPALYLWEAGQLEPVSILPDSEGATMPAPVLLGSGPGSVRNAVSEDGSRVFWSNGTYGSNANNLTGLYLRDTPSDNTVRLDTVKDGDDTGEVRPLFQGANPSGTVVYFTDSHHLTADASPEGRDLYRCEIPGGSPAGGCATLTNLTGPATSGGESAEVQGLLSGMSDEGERIYFVAEGVLAANENELGDTAQPGEPNLYFSEEGASPRFIASLSEDDEPDWGGRFKVASEMSATASPDGRYLAFNSNRSLTGQPNEDLATGKPVEHVFLYDSGSDELQCVSCNPTGAASQAQVSLGYSQLVDSQRQWEGHRVTAILPPTTVNEIANASLYRNRVVFEGGRVFFNALDGLVSADANNQWDVYQFEPLGEGSCSESSGGSAVARSGDGCVSLISSGTASEEAVFLDASATGNDAFFLSSARLSALDVDEELDVYDARVGGVVAEAAPASECSGEACRPSPLPPGFVDPTTSDTSKGNLPAAKKKCPKGKKKVRKNGKVRCVPKHKKPHKQKSHGDKSGRASR
jgi:hypothetical protein